MNREDSLDRTIFRHPGASAIPSRIHLWPSLRQAIEVAGRTLAHGLEVHGRFARWVRGDDTYPWPASRALEDKGLLDAVAAARARGRIEKIAPPAPSGTPEVLGSP